MKILLGSYADFNALLGVEQSLKALGHEVVTFDTRDYMAVCSYFAKKKAKLGFSGRAQYENKIAQKIIRTAAEFCPQLILFINGPEKVLTPTEFSKLQLVAKKIGAAIAVYFVDPVEKDIVSWAGRCGHAGIEEYYPYFDNVFVYEKTDVKYLSAGGVHPTYIPLGFNELYSRAIPAKAQDIDIIFVGNAHNPRLKILTELARIAKKRDWNLKIVGPMYDTRYCWKKWQFKKKYPEIFQFLEATQKSPTEVAELYTRAKIALNIHKTGALSLNPRSFEIMAAGGFELTDARGDYAGLTVAKMLAVFKDTTELIDKIEYYLAHTAERQQIAACGRDFVRAHYSMRQTMAKIIKTVTEDKNE